MSIHVRLVVHLVAAVGGMLVIITSSYAAIQRYARRAEVRKIVAEAEQRLSMASVSAESLREFHSAMVVAPEFRAALGARIEESFRQGVQLLQEACTSSQAVQDEVGAILMGIRMSAENDSRENHLAGSHSVALTEDRLEELTSRLAHLQPAVHSSRIALDQKLAGSRHFYGWILGLLCVGYVTGLWALYRKMDKSVLGPLSSLERAVEVAFERSEPFTQNGGAPPEISRLGRKLVRYVSSLQSNVQERASELTNANKNLRLVNVTLQKEMRLRQSVEEQLRHDALHDSLTKLPNRMMLLERIQYLVERSKRDAGFKFAVLFLDIDNFKNINDSLGHSAGDELLKEVATRLSACVRSMDTVSRGIMPTTARLGGDEFVVLLDNIQGEQDAIHVAERVQQQLAVPIKISNESIAISASIGIAVSDSRNFDSEGLLRDADTAMYRAKQAGKVQHAVFDRTMHVAAKKRLTLENELRQAVERREFLLHFQPIVSLAGGKLCGFEALLRWRRPNGKLVSPREFVPVAEETGLIVPIGEWVLKRACRQLREWQEHVSWAASLSLSVNISRRQLLTPKFREDLERIIVANEINSKFLNLEVTEGAVMEVSDNLVSVLEDLRRMGVRLHMDDFGTGHSSLSCLQSLPFDVIKVDRSFVQRLERNGNRGGIVQGIMTMARSLNMQVIAEGIENLQQLSALLQLDCDFGQGFYFSTPVDSRTAGQILLAPTPWAGGQPKLLGKECQANAHST